MSDTENETENSALNSSDSLDSNPSVSQPVETSTPRIARHSSVNLEFLNGLTDDLEKYLRELEEQKRLAKQQSLVQTSVVSNDESTLTEGNSTLENSQLNSQLSNRISNPIMTTVEDLTA